MIWYASLMPAEQYSIEVCDLIKRYRKSTSNAVDGVSFRVKKGEFFSLLGPNGAGKTTTISILTTTLAKSSGEVFVAGADVAKETDEVRQHCGIIFQNPSLDKNLTAEENIRFHALLYGLYPFRPRYAWMPQEYKQKVAQLAEILGISNEINRQISTFSGGMKRKLEILRSLMHEPDILFLDEPTSGLDASSRRGLWEYIKKINRERGTTVFLSTHYLEEAEGADNICIISGGKILAQGSVREIKSQLIDDYLLIDASDRAQLRMEVLKLGFKFEEADEGLRLPINGLSAQDLIQKIQTRLTSLTTHTPSLEDAYLEIISRGQTNDK